MMHAAAGDSRGIMSRIATSRFRRSVRIGRKSGPSFQEAMGIRVEPTRAHISEESSSLARQSRVGNSCTAAYSQLTRSHGVYS
jgi:type II secretory pathway component PulF